MRDVSTPPFLALPPGARPERWALSRGVLAAVLAEPMGAAAGGTAVLVPGFTGSKEDFVAVLAPLTAHGWRVVALDLLGQYESVGPADEAAYSLDRLGADVRELLDRVRARWPGPVHLVGHSLGGLVAREAVLATAAAGDPLPGSLTLLCSGPGALPASRAEPLRRLFEALPALPLEVVWAAKEAADREGGWRPPSEEVAAFVRRRFLANSPYALRAKARALLEAEDGVDALAALAAEGALPVLVMYGEHDDAWTPQEQDAMAARLGGLPLVLAGAGHSPAVDAPGATASLLDGFWRSGDPARAGFAGHEASVTEGVGPVSYGYTQAVHVDRPLPWEPTAPRTARQLLVEALGSGREAVWGGEQRTDDAALVLSELVTNAIRHGSAPLHLRLEVAGRLLRMEVTDGEPTRVPVARGAALDDTGGRGIALVTALVDRWGWARRADGKVVWAEFADHAGAGTGTVDGGSPADQSRSAGSPSAVGASAAARASSAATASSSGSASTAASPSSQAARPSQDARAGAAR